MKAIESFSVSESFGLKDLSLEEIESINGGAKATEGSCINISGANSGTLTGAVGPTIPSGPTGPVGPIDVGSGSGSGK